MNKFLNYLFEKPDRYVLVWAFILSKLKNNTCELDKLYVMSKFKLNRTTFTRIIDYGLKYSGEHSMNLNWTRNTLIVSVNKRVREQRENTSVQVLEPTLTEIITFFNQILQRNGKRGIKENNKSAISYINKRLKEGHTIDEFKDVMLAQEKWLHDPKMHTYYRPSTLFSGKFEEYLNNITQPDESTNNNKRTQRLFDALKEAESDSF
tara:strand:- start:1677 stop:2297 length:621 start_codon:yes stop_codon:yes gene_type:complete